MKSKTHGSLLVIGVGGFLLIGGLFYGLNNVINENAERQKPLQVEDKKPTSITSTKLPSGYTVDTIRHDGHLFVVVSHDAIIHHPSCPCQHPAPEVEKPKARITF